MSLGITNSQSFLPGEMGLLLGTLDVPFFTREKIDKMCKANCYPNGVLVYTGTIFVTTSDSVQVTLPSNVSYIRLRIISSNVALSTFPAEGAKITRGTSVAIECSAGGTDDGRPILTFSSDGVLTYPRCTLENAYFRGLIEGYHCFDS
jgi:hypothetical protein